PRSCRPASSTTPRTTISSTWRTPRTRTATARTTAPAWRARSAFCRLRLADVPGVGAGQQRGEFTRPVFGARGVDLPGHQLVIAGLLHLPEYAHRRVPEVRRVQPGQRERIGRVGPVRVVHDRLIRVVGRLQLAVAAEPQPGAARPHRCTVLELEQ